MVKLKKQTNLVRRKDSGIYYFRARVPKLLVSVLGKKAIFDSLNTKDPGEATALAAARRHEIQQALIQVKAQSQVARPVGTIRRLFLADEEIQRICESYKAKWLAQDEQMRRAGLSGADGDLYSDIIESHHQVVTAAAARGDVSQIEGELSRHLRELALDIDRSTETYRDLAYAMLVAEAEVSHARMEREAGRAVSTPKVMHSDLTLDKIVDYWATHTSALPRTKRAVQSVFNELKILHPGVSAGALRKTHLVKFRDALHEQGQSPKTIYKKLSFIHAAFAVALDSELVELNPVTGVKAPKDKRVEKPRVPFNLDDLHNIFAAPVHAAGKRPKGGGGAASYWLPLIALYSGARVEELAQLRVGDVMQESEFGFYFNITTEGEGNRLKTKNARRRVPVHPELSALGFFEYLEACKKTKHEFLFPDLKPDVEGKRSGNWSKWFGRYKRKHGITDKRKVFHSFRHCFIDACRAVGIQTEVRDVLVGHANDSVAAEYGEGRYPIAPLFDAMSRVKYSGLDLKRLLDRR